MSGLFDTFETNAAKEQNGVEIELGINRDGTKPTFLIAATSKANVKYARTLNRATKPFRRNMDAMADEHADNLYKDVFVKTVLKGWNNVEVTAKYVDQFSGVAQLAMHDDNGAYTKHVVPFTIPNALKLFELLPRLYDELVQRAGSIELFRENQLEEEAKN